MDKTKDDEAAEMAAATENAMRLMEQLDEQARLMEHFIIALAGPDAFASAQSIALVDAHLAALDRLNQAAARMAAAVDKWRPSPYIAPGEAKDTSAAEYKWQRSDAETEYKWQPEPDTTNPTTRDTDLLWARVDRVVKEIRTEMRSLWERIRHAEDRAGQAEGRLNLIEDTLRDMAAPGWRPTAPMNEPPAEKSWQTEATEGLRKAMNDALSAAPMRTPVQQEARDERLTKEQTVPQEMLDKMTENFLNGLNDTWSPERNAERAAIKAWQDEVADVKTTKPGPTKCRARQYGDRTACDPCALAWDTNDAEPPACMWRLDRTETKS